LDIGLKPAFFKYNTSPCYCECTLPFVAIVLTEFADWKHGTSRYNKVTIFKGKLSLKKIFISWKLYGF